MVAILVCLLTLVIYIIHIFFELGIKITNYFSLKDRELQLYFAQAKYHIFLWDLYFFAWPKIISLLIYVIWGELASKLFYLQIIGPGPFWEYPSDLERKTMSSDDIFLKYGYRVNAYGHRYLTYEDVIKLLKNTNLAEGDLLSFSLTTIRYTDDYIDSTGKKERLYLLYVYDQAYNPVVIAPVAPVSMKYGKVSDVTFDFVDPISLNKLCMGALNGEEGRLELLITMKVVGNSENISENFTDWLLVPSYIRFICHPIDGLF